MRKKVWILILIVITLLVNLTACGKEEETSQEVGETSVDNVVIKDAPEEELPVRRGPSVRFSC